MGLVKPIHVTKTTLLHYCFNGNKQTKKNKFLLNLLRFITIILEKKKWNSKMEVPRAVRSVKADCKIRRKIKSRIKQVCLKVTLLLYFLLPRLLRLQTWMEVQKLVTNKPPKDRCKCLSVKYNPVVHLPF